MPKVYIDRKEKTVSAVLKLLNGYMKGRTGTQVAASIGMNRVMYGRKLNGKSVITLPELIEIVNELEIPGEEIGRCLEKSW